MNRNPWEPDESVKKASALLIAPPPAFRLRLVHIMLLVLGFALIFAGLVALGPGAIFAFAFLVAGLVVGVVVVILQRRATQQDALIWVLAIASEGGMPLAPALAAFSAQCGGLYRRKVFALAEELAAGATLPEALERVPRVFPRDAELLARVGWEAGTLPAALREAAGTRTTLRPMWLVISSRVAYFLWVLVIMEVIASFVLIFITPKFEAIFRDFGVPLPAVTTAVIAASHVIAHFGWFTFPMIILAEVVLLFYWPISFLGWANYHVPVIDRLFIRRHTALLLRCLGWVAEGGRPLGWGLDLTARWYPTRWVARRLGRVAEDVHRGDEWTAALARRGLIRPADVALLESAQRVGNLPWALREAAEGSERRLAYRLQVVAGALFPVVVVALGLLVGLFAAAFFTPLTILIERLAR